MHGLNLHQSRFQTNESKLEIWSLHLFFLIVVMWPHKISEEKHKATVILFLIEEMADQSMNSKRLQLEKNGKNLTLHIFALFFSFFFITQPTAEKPLVKIRHSRNPSTVAKCYKECEDSCEHRINIPRRHFGTPVGLDPDFHP